MARFLDTNANNFQALFDAPLQSSRLLELGAGCGLVSIVGALHRADVYSTEQDTCLPYLNENLKLNPDVKINHFHLNWGNPTCLDRFDIILGCDITYEPSNFEGLFRTFDACLSTQGIILLVHDNDSCPLSAQAFDSLVKLSGSFKFNLSEISYADILDSSFVRLDVKMWKLGRHL